MKRLMMYCAALAALTTTGLAREAATVVETAGPATWAAEDALGRKVGFYAPKTIRLESRGDWVDVSPSYPASRGNTLRRDAIGYAGIRNTDDSARNDIVETKVARDAEHVWFAIRAAAPLTPSSDRAWMTLFVDTDRAKATGWQGYDLVVNRLSPEGGKAVVEVADGRGWTWRRVAQAACHVDGDLLVLELPRTLFGSWLDFEFKVGDNLRLEGDVMDFYVSGDVAPLGRFNYVFTE